MPLYVTPHPSYSKFLASYSIATSMLVMNSFSNVWLQPYKALLCYCTLSRTLNKKEVSICVMSDYVKFRSNPLQDFL